MDERRQERVRPQDRQLVGELFGPLALDAGGATHAVRTRVQAFLHAHDAHARFLVARPDGALDGRRAADVYKRQVITYGLLY